MSSSTLISVPKLDALEIQGILNKTLIMVNPENHPIRKFLGAFHLINFLFQEFRELEVCIAREKDPNTEPFLCTHLITGSTCIPHLRFKNPSEVYQEFMALEYPPTSPTLSQVFLDEPPTVPTYEYLESLKFRLQMSIKTPQRNARDITFDYYC